NELGLDIPLSGLVKDGKHPTGELFSGDPREIVPLERRSHAFYLVQRIQDEAHRCATTFHRRLRGKGLLQWELDNIPGVGPKRRNTLLTHLKSISEIKRASIEAITKLGIPEHVAMAIHEGLQEETPTNDA